MFSHKFILMEKLNKIIIFNFIAKHMNLTDIDNKKTAFFFTVINGDNISQFC